MNKKKKIVLCSIIFVLSIIFGILCAVLIRLAQNVNVIDWKSQTYYGTLMSGGIFCAIFCIVALSCSILIFTFYDDEM